MKEINKFRLLAGIPIDAAAEKTVIKEARETPKRREQLTQVNDKTMKARVNGVQSAIKHTLNAIKALEKVPATDYNGEIQHAIAELEGVLNDEDSSAGLNTVLIAYEKAQRKHTRGEKAKVRQEEEEARAILDDLEPEDEMDDELDPTGGMGKHIYDHPEDDPDYEDEEEMPEEEMPEEPGKYDGEMGDDMRRDDFDVDDMRDEARERRSRRHRRGNRMDEAKADKDYDGNGKVESEKEEHEGAVAKAIKKKENNKIDEAEKIKDDLYDENDSKDVTDESPSQLREPNKDSEQDQSTQDLEDKITVPANIKSALRTEIEQARKEAKKMDTRDKDAAYFYNDLAQAFEDLLGHLDKGTRYDLKQAQVFAQSLMGPMLHKLPTEVWKFLANGGETRSLRSIMKDVSKEYPKTGPQDKLK